MKNYVSILESLKAGHPDRPLIPLLTKDRKLVSSIRPAHAVRLLESQRFYMVSDRGVICVCCRHPQMYSDWVGMDAPFPLGVDRSRSQSSVESGAAAYVARLEAQRREAMGNVIGAHSLAQWNELLAMYHYSCVRCHASASDVKLTRDHIDPIASGGTDFITNIQPLCRLCNSWKGNRYMDFRSTFLRSFKASI